MPNKGTIGACGYTRAAGAATAGSDLVPQNADMTARDTSTHAPEALEPSPVAVHRTREYSKFEQEDK